MVLLRSLLTLLFTLLFISCVYQRPDMNTDLSVKTPHYARGPSPHILFDAGHNNFHSISTTYQPFARLLENDGLHLKEHHGHFTLESLEDADLLIIANAMSPGEDDPDYPSAFSPDEIKRVKNWVKTGGSLLLIADHDPFGQAASALAQGLGVGMESVWTVDTLRADQNIDRTTWLTFNRQNQGFGEHEVLGIDGSGSTVSQVITFTGQSLSHDSTWTSLLKLSPAARNYHRREDAKIVSPDTSTFFPVPGQSQLIACEYGAGRIVISGEAAMFTAQEVRIFFKTMKAGFNYAGYDNKELLLNVIHWLLLE